MNYGITHRFLQAVNNVKQRVIGINDRLTRLKRVGFLLTVVGGLGTLVMMLKLQHVAELSQSELIYIEVGRILMFISFVGIAFVIIGDDMVSLYRGERGR